jgi:hypothetical protein
MTLTQTYGSLITPADFTATGIFSLGAPTSGYQTETITDLSFTIAGKTYTSNASIQFVNTGSNPAIQAQTRQ